jgi:hypothetical protein
LLASIHAIENLPAAFGIPSDKVLGNLGDAEAAAILFDDKSELGSQESCERGSIPRTEEHFLIVEKATVEGPSGTLGVHAYVVDDGMAVEIRVLGTRAGVLKDGYDESDWDMPASLLRLANAGVGEVVFEDPQGGLHCLVMQSANRFPLAK